MIPVLTPQSMRDADRAGVQELGFSSIDLMENASRSCADIIHAILPDNSSILVLCGTGNNGGDGFAIARMMSVHHQVRVGWIGDEGRMTPETTEEFARCVQSGVQCLHLSSHEQLSLLFAEPFTCIVDALIGIGGSENLRGFVTEVLIASNRARCLRVAVDVPTGLNALTGEAHEHCFAAHHTITMAAVKTGLCMRKGKDVCGRVHLATIGLTPEIVSSRTSAFIIEREDVASVFTARQSDSSKFDYGRVCVVAGSRDMPGAAALCANAAIMSGAGMVELCSTFFHAQLLPEVLQTHVAATNAGTIGSDNYERLRLSCSRAQCIVIGPGMGRHEETSEVVRKLIAEFASTIPMIIDADALSALNTTTALSPLVMLTPHAGEYRRLLEQIHYTRETDVDVREFASHMGCCVVAKGVPVKMSNGTLTMWNTNGNAGMATAGSGDVLAGVIASMVCRDRELQLLQRVAAGVFIHGLAGDIAAEHFTQEGVTASRIVSMLHKAFAEILASRHDN